MSDPVHIGDATLYLGDCLEILPTLDKVDAVVTDPPYGEGFDFDNDVSPTDAADFLGAALSAFVPESGCYLAVFWTNRSLDLLLDQVRGRRWSYLRVLQMVCSGTARPHLGFVPRLQPIALFRAGSRANELHDRFAPAAAAAIEKSGLSRGAIARILGCDSRLVQKWSRHRDPSWCLPTPRFYGQFRDLVALGSRFDDEILSRERAAQFVPNTYQRDLLNGMVGVAGGNHPTEKPVKIMASILTGLPGNTILDPFMGSGTTGVACAKLGRKFIGVEIEPKYFDIACKRIKDAYAQPDLFIESPIKSEQLSLDAAE